MKPYFGLRGGWLTFWVSVACSTDMTLFGYDQGVFGGIVVTPDFLETLGLVDNPGLLGTVIAIYNIGCFVGAVSAMWIGEALGRPKTVLLGTTIMTVGAVLQIAAYGVPQMIVARVVAGIGNGINTATAPVWQSETSQMKWRGKLVVIELILNIAGFSLSNWVTYGLSFASGPVSWRFPIAFQLVFILILFATVPWLPESPRWLIAHGREDAAFQILADLEDRELDDPWILAQHKEIVFAVDYERRNAVGWADLLRGRTGPQGGTCTVRRLLLGAGTQAMQQLAGINVTSYYLPTVLIESVRVDEKLARLLAAVNSVSYLLFSLIAIPNVERWGRRRLMMFGALGQGVCYMLITILIKYSLDDSYSAAQQKQFGSASIAFFFLYYVFFGIGWQGVPWLYPVEVNSLSMRTKGAAIGTASNWIFNFMVVEITPIGIATLSWRFYIIWTIFNFAFLPTIYFLYPETAARTLEDIDRFFRDNHHILIHRDKKATSAQRPPEYVEHETNEVRRASSVDAATMRRMSRVGGMMDLERLSVGEGGMVRMPEDDGLGEKDIEHDDKV